MMISTLKHRRVVATATRGTMPQGIEREHAMEPGTAQDKKRTLETSDCHAAEQQRKRKDSRAEQEGSGPVAHQPSSNVGSPGTRTAGGSAPARPSIEDYIRTFTTCSPRVDLLSLSDLMDQASQDELLGPFSKEEAVLPCRPRAGKDEAPVADMRFAAMNPNAPDGYRTEEAAKIFATYCVSVGGVSGSGKTSMIFDYARKQPLIYVACATNPDIPADNQTRDRLFERLIKELNEQCDAPLRAGEISMMHATARAEYLICADIYARLLFVLHLLRTRDHDVPITPESILLTQLYEAHCQETMLCWFDRLARCASGVTERGDLSYLTSYCAMQLRDDLKRKFGSTSFCELAVAIDEAQAAARLFVDQENDSDGFHFDREYRDHEFQNCALLHKYRSHWQLCADTILVVGTNTRKPINPLYYSPGKPLIAPVIFPYLDDDDVRKRLKRMLNVTDEDLNEVPNLHLLTGRCRWVAALVDSLIQDRPWVGSDGTQAGWADSAHQAHATKAAMLRNAIAKMARTQATQMYESLQDMLQASEDADASNTATLLQRLHAVGALFRQKGTRLNQQFPNKDLTNLLGLGVAPLLDEGVVSVSVALDEVGAEALRMLAHENGWRPAETFAQSLFEHRQRWYQQRVDDEFETVVAAALVSFEGTVADLITEANGGVEPDDLPADHWTREAHLKFKYHGDHCGSFYRTFDAIVRALRNTDPEKSLLLRPDDRCRPNFFAIVREKRDDDQAFAFLLLASVRLWSERISESPRSADLQSTILEQCYSCKPDEWQHGMYDFTSESRHAREGFENLVPRIREATGQAEVRGARELRLHVVLPGYAKLKGRPGDPIPEEEGPGFDPEMRTPRRVFIDGNKVRVIIDPANYGALFTTPETRQVVDILLERKRASDPGWLADDSDQKEADG